MKIESKTNPKYKYWSDLAKHRTRRETGAFIIEGKREVLRALQANVALVALVFSQKAQEQFDYHSTWDPWLEGLPVYTLSDKLFKTLSLREHPDGVMAIAKAWNTDLSHLSLNPKGLYLLVEKLEKPGNLGALMRSAEATGVDGILIADPCVDVFHPNVIRASQGALFALKVYCGTSQDLYALLKDSDLTLWATTPHATTLFWDCDMTQGCVICIGSEAHGLSALWMESAEKIKIPMYGVSADSLNANISGTLCLYEARRQRHQHGLC